MDALRSMPTFISAATAHSGLVPARLNEVNLRLHHTDPHRHRHSIIAATPTGFDSAFFDEAATGAEADQATTHLRASLMAIIAASDAGVPVSAYLLTSRRARPR